MTSVNFIAFEKSGEADIRQWVSAPGPARWRSRTHEPCRKADLIVMGGYGHPRPRGGCRAV
jgi:hypothetical protein